MLVYTHPDCAGHLVPAGHAERPERLGAVERGLAGIAAEWRQCPLAGVEDVLRCHPRAHFDHIAATVPARGIAALDPDTFLSPRSLDAALRALGGACAAVDAVVAGESRAAFVATRPPGHHAERSRAMGFACSAMPPSRRAAHSTITGCRGSPSSISMCTTATARRIWCGTRGAACSSRRIRCRSIPARARRAKGAHMTRS